MDNLVSVSVIKKLLVYFITSFLLISYGGLGWGNTAGDLPPLTHKGKMPNSLNFMPLISVVPNIQVRSKIINISDSNTITTLTNSNGEYSIYGDNITSTPSTTINNKIFKLKTERPFEFLEAKEATFKLNDLSVSLSVSMPTVSHLISLNLMEDSEVRAVETHYEWRVEGFIKYYF